MWLSWDWVSLHDQHTARATTGGNNTSAVTLSWQCSIFMHLDGRLGLMRVHIGMLGSCTLCTTTYVCIM